MSGKETQDPRTWAEQNRRSWNEATRAHNSHKADQARFLRDGGSTLFPEELELLGRVEGQRILHLQCNAGQDTLSLAALGADVTGVDISDEAIEFATRLSAESGLPGTFERADVYDWLDAAGEAGRRFDAVFSTYGALPWLSDLERWARGVAGVLETGGRLVSLEFHPFAWVFDGDWNPHYPYSSGGVPWREDGGVNDYVAGSGDALSPSGHVEGEAEFHNPEAAWEFAWGVGDIVNAVALAGMRIRRVVEYPYANGCAIQRGMRREGRRFYPPEGFPNVPLMLGVAATRDLGGGAGG